MKKITLFVVLFFCVWHVWAQNSEEDLEINRDFATQMQAIFGELETDRVPHGILAEYAFPFADLNVYNGALTDSTTIDIGVFSNIYKTLMMGRIHPRTEADFEDMQVIAKRWGDYRKNFNNNPVADRATVVLSGLLYSYTSLPEESFRTQKIAHRGNAVRDVYANGVWQNPYVEKETAAITPPLSDFNTRKFNVMLPADLFLTNQREQINIQADFADGSGFRPFPIDSLIPIDYTADGRYDWVFKIDRSGRPPLKIKVTVLIQNAQSVSATEVVVPNGLHTAVLRISHASAHNKKIKKPLIVAEGFDPGGVLSPEKIGGDMTLEHFIKSYKNISEIEDLLKGNTQEYDIIYVDWENGIGDIRQNAVTLEKVIDWVNGQKQANGSTEPNVLLGQSMGGLIGRYTLVKMEQKNKVHDVRLFVAHDSPFQGANTPVSAQMLSRHLLKVYLSNPVATAVMEMLVPFVQDFGQMIDSGFLDDYTTPYEALTVQDAPAALQMTKYHVSRDYTVSVSVQTAFQNEMDAMGYPQQSRNVAISNGNLCGLNNGYDGGANLFLLDKTGSGKNIFTDILHHLGASLWGFTSDNVKLGLIALIPGTAKIDYLIDLRAVPEQNASNRVVYRGKARYHVVLWKIGNWGPTISTDIVPLKQISASNQLLPVETFAGGINSIKSAAGNINFFPIPEEAYINPRYGFVPITSALDIKRTNNSTLTVSDNRKPYYSQQNLTNNSLHTPFINFVTERVTGNNNNFSHISFSTRNGSWLAQELDGNNGVVTDCSFVCATDEQVITGNALICQTEFYQTSLNADSYQWQVIQGSDLVTLQVVNNKKVSLTRGANKNGLVVLQLKMSSTNCGEVTFTKRIWVGKPEVRAKVDYDPQIWSFRNIEILPKVNLGLSESDIEFFQIDNIEWIVNSTQGMGAGFMVTGSPGLTGFAHGNDSYWRVNLTIKVYNQCGVSTIQATASGGYGDMGNEIPSRIPKIMNASNPNEYEVLYETQDENGRITYEALDITDKVDIYVHNMGGQLMKMVHKPHVNISNLPSGAYLLNAIINDTDHAELKVYK